MGAHAVCSAFGMAMLPLVVVQILVVVVVWVSHLGFMVVPCVGLVLASCASGVQALCWGLAPLCQL